MTTGWLAERLGAPPGSLVSFTPRRIGTGQMCDSYRLALDWEGHDGPEAIVAKCPSTDQSSRQIAKTVHCYWLEVNWYRELAGEIPVTCPPCFHAEIADNETDFALLLGDMAPAEQGDQLAGAEIAEIEAAIGEAAKLHARLWNSDRLNAIPWLNRTGDNSPLVRMLLPQLYRGFRERYRDRLAPEILAMGDQFIAGLDGYLDAEPFARTLCHGDFRIDNLLFGPGGGVTVVDWQTLQIGTGLSDIAYLIGTSIADPDRRKSEEGRLVDLYCELLESRGRAIDREGAWLAYRRAAFAGFVMAIFASMNVQRTTRGDEMFAVMAERPARQILDLDSLALL
ncbi:MAG: aminoglycoside phosphotransferase family protein [Sphingomonadales bacterium]|nr:aminoglycoside phosphotransferase family protein [Sphingomonadales bacterium]